MISAVVDREAVGDGGGLLSDEFVAAVLEHIESFHDRDAKITR